MSGVSICIGGLIGAGKTTFIQALQSFCKKENINSYFIDEIFPEAQREMLVVNNIAVDSAIFGQRLEASRLLPHLAYDVAIQERNHWDHLAFHIALTETNRLPQEILPWGKKMVEQINPPPPDFYLYLDLSAEEAYNRKAARKSTNDDFFDLDFMTKLKAAYEKVIPPNAIKLDWTNFGRELDLSQLFKAILQKDHQTAQALASNCTPCDSQTQNL